MSKLTEQYKTLGIHNPHNFAGHGNVFIDYTPNARGRMSRVANWRVYRPGFKTDPDAHWMDNGNKRFSVWGRGTHSEVKAQKLQEAKDWASAKYGIKEWAKTPFGSWMDAEFVKARIAELDALIKESA